MRNPLAMDVFNEEICTFLKKKIKGSLVSVRKRALILFAENLARSFYGFEPVRNHLLDRTPLV
jgi:hypothetical protein